MLGRARLLERRLARLRLRSGDRRPPAHPRRLARPRRCAGEPAAGLSSEQRDVCRHRLRCSPPSGRAHRAVSRGGRHGWVLRLPAYPDSLRAPRPRFAARLRRSRILVTAPAAAHRRDHGRRRRDGRARRRRRSWGVPSVVRHTDGADRAALRRPARRARVRGGPRGAGGRRGAPPPCSTADVAVGGLQARVRALSGPRGGQMTRSDVFRAGDVLNGYRLLEDFRVVGAGLSEWSFAERGGRIFFIKRFLSPTYPEANAPGSERIKAKKRARCAAFEAHHRGIQAAMAPLTTYGGNLIATLDF